MRTAWRAIGLALLLALAAGRAEANETYWQFITGQPTASTPYVGTDWLALVRGGVTYKVPGTALLSPGTNDRVTVNGTVCPLGSSCTISGTTSLGTSPLLMSLPNSSFGTTTGALVVYTTAGEIKNAATTDKAIIGVCVSGCGVSGNALVAILGQVSCNFDGSTTAGDFIEPSTTIAGDCHDSGSSSSVPLGVPVIGNAQSSNTGAGAYSINFANTGIAGALSGAYFAIANNLSEGVASTMRTNLGLGTAALANTGASGHTLPYLDVPNVFSARPSVPLVALTFGSTVTPDASLSTGLKFTATGNFTLANPINLVEGQTLNVEILQDATGGRVMTLGSDYQAPGGSSSLVLSTAPNAKDLLSCTSDTASTLICVLLLAIAH